MTFRHWDRVALVVLIAVFAAMSYAAGIRAFRPEFVAAAFISGALVVYFWWRDVLSIRTILLVAFVLRLLFMPLVPGLTDDMFRYIWDGILATSGINPFQYVPSDPFLSYLHDESLFRLLNSRDVYSVYPPVSQAIFYLGGLVYNGDWGPSYYLIKVVITIAEFGGIWFLSKHVSSRALILLAWHPVILIASAGQGHTDALLVLFLGAGVVYAMKEKGSWAAVLVTIAGWVKLFPFFFLPLIWRRFGIKSMVTSAAVGILLALPLAAPYVPGNVGQSLDLYIRSFEFNAGAYYGVKKLFYIFTEDDWSKQLGPAFRVTFFLILPFLYWFDWRRKWPIEKTALYISGALILTATTIHPWYLVGLLVLVALNEKPRWHWQWVGLLAIGTYLLYVGGPYWTYVNLTWIGFAVIFLVSRGDPVLQWVQRWRARKKVNDIRWMLEMNPRGSVLDLGAGEGYVGQEISSQLESDVRLIDVVDMNRVSLPFELYDGETLPMEDNSVDCTVLYYVLHHTKDPERVVEEARRVSKHAVVIVESVYRSAFGHKVLRFLDVTLNRIRSFGTMNDQEEHLSFDTKDGWESRLGGAEGRILASKESGHPLERRAYFLVDAA